MWRNCLLTIRSHAVLLALIIAAAAGARLALYFLAPNVVTPDTALYIQSGNSLFTNWRMSSPLYMPLYPIALHLAGYHGVIFFQIALSTATVFLVYRITVAIWADRMAGLLAAAFCAAHPLLAYFAVARVTETLATFLLILGIDQFYRRNILPASIALVLLDLTRPSFDLILPAMVMIAEFAT